VTPVQQPPTLKDYGIDKRDAHRWQKLAAIPSDDFEAHVAAVRQKGERLTTRGVVAAHAAPTQASKPLDTMPPRSPYVRPADSASWSAAIFPVGLRFRLTVLRGM
jgi:hypothetical protein